MQTCWALPGRRIRSVRTLVTHSWSGAFDRTSSCARSPVRWFVIDRPGAMLLAGSTQAKAVARVVAVDDDGQVHFAILPGSIAKNRHLLDRSVA